MDNFIAELSSLFPPCRSHGWLGSKHLYLLNLLAFISSSCQNYSVVIRFHVLSLFYIRIFLSITQIILRYSASDTHTYSFPPSLSLCLSLPPYLLFSLPLCPPISSLCMNLDLHSPLLFLYKFIPGIFSNAGDFLHLVFQGVVYFLMIFFFYCFPHLLPSPPINYIPWTNLSRLHIS